MKALARLRRIVAGILRGLSDEEAYARHLAHRGAAPSAEEWRRFCEHRLRSRYERGRCC